MQGKVRIRIQKIAIAWSSWFQQWRQSGDSVFFELSIQRNYIVMYQALLLNSIVDLKSLQIIRVACVDESKLNIVAGAVQSHCKE